MSSPCSRCGGVDFGHWTSTSSGKIHRYCRPCRRVRAELYLQRRLANGGRHTRQEWQDLLQRTPACVRCGKLWADIPPRPDRRYRQVWTKDHITPLRAGGENSIGNLQPLCYRCNSSKGIGT